MKEKWQQLSSRERRLVLIMASVLIASVFYFGLWQPLQDGTETTRMRVKAQQIQLQQMLSQAAEVKQLLTSKRGSASVKSSSSLLVVIEQTAQQKQIKSHLNKVQPEGSNGVRVWIDNAPFDTLVDWLALLAKKSGVYVGEISIERQKDPGRVNGRVLLQVAS
jgi:general secretion pathway protein M